MSDVLPFPERDEPPHLGLVPAVEALLFAAGEPVTAGAIATALQVEDPTLVQAAIEVLAASYTSRGGGLTVQRVNKGWQMRTHSRFAAPVLALRGGRPQKLSQAALEVLAVVAYQQPVTRGDVDDIRGVSSGALVKTLLDKGLLRVTGRRDVPGKPLEYGTTPGFLELFGLPDLKALPTLAEREALVEDRDGGP